MLPVTARCFRRSPSGGDGLVTPKTCERLDRTKVRHLASGCSPLAGLRVERFAEGTLLYIDASAASCTSVDVGRLPQRQEGSRLFSIAVHWICFPPAFEDPNRTFDSAAGRRGSSIASLSKRAFRIGRGDRFVIG